MFLCLFACVLALTLPSPPPRSPVSVYDHLHYFGYEETCSSNAFGRMPSDDYVLNIDPAIVRSPGAKPPQTVPLPDFAETATA